MSKSNINILIPVCFTVEMTRVLNSISHLFRDNHVKLHLLHITDFYKEYSISNTLKENLDNFHQYLLESLNKKIIDFGEDVESKEFDVQTHVGSGDIVEGIKTYCNENPIDLIVMPTHARKGIFHLLIGSVTEKVIRSVSIPVLSVQPFIYEPKE